MTSNERDGKALGMMKTSDKLKSKLAEERFEFNRKTDRVHGEIFNDLFTIFMWEEEERRQHRLKRRKRMQEEEEREEEKKMKTDENDGHNKRQNSYLKNS